MEVARASLNTVRQQLTSGGGRVAEPPQPRTNNPLPRVTIPPLSVEAQREEVPSPALNDLRAAVDALKKPRRPEPIGDESTESAPHPAEIANGEEPPEPIHRT